MGNIQSPWKESPCCVWCHSVSYVCSGEKHFIQESIMTDGICVQLVVQGLLADSLSPAWYFL